MALTKSVTRLITGLVFGFSALFAIISGGIYIALLILLLVVLASKEYVEILKNKGFRPSQNMIYLSIAIFGALCYFDRMDLAAPAFTICTFFAFMSVLFKGKQPYIANVATTILGFVYCAWFPLHLLLIRDLNSYPYFFKGIIKHNASSEGATYALLLFLAVIITDSFCYYCGSYFGKHQLSKVISPNKTIEGAIGGTIMCVIFCLLYGIGIGLAWYHAFVLGLLIAIFAQIGDLCESMIKRDAGVKDSSNVLPGHGGFLDRTDSFVFTIPVVYYYLNFFVVNNTVIDFIKGLF